MNLAKFCKPVSRNKVPIYTSELVQEQFPTHVRTVNDAGAKWMEFGFESPEPLSGNSGVGFSDEEGYVWISLHWSENLANWSVGKFIPAPIPLVWNEDKTAYTYWARATNPIDAEVKTGVLTCFSETGTGDARSNPMTSMTIAGVVQTLPNFPYYFDDSADMAQLQADLIDAGWVGSVVTAVSAVEWSIVIPDVDYTSYAQDSSVGWASYVAGQDPVFGGDIISSGRAFSGEFVDAYGTRIVTKAFARLGVDPGRRYGFSGPQYPKNPFYEQPAYVPPPPPGDPYVPPVVVESVPYINYSTSLEITGSYAPGAVLTKPTVTWMGADSVVGTWWKNGVATSEHGDTYADTVDGDRIQYKEVATNAQGTSNPSENSWRVFEVSQFLQDFITENDTAIKALTINGGKPGGVSNLEMFSAFNYTAPRSFTRNPNLWLAPYIAQMTGVVAYKDNGISWSWCDSYGGVMITQRHVLYCEHAHPLSKGAWSIAPNAELKLVFALADGTPVECVQMGQNHSSASSSVPGYADWSAAGLASADFCVAVTEKTADEMGVAVMPILELSEEIISAMRKLSSGPRFAISQGTARAGVVPSIPASPNHPVLQHPMAYLGTPGSYPGLEGYGYYVWKGDSGTPGFFLHRGVVYLDQIMTSTGNLSGWPVSSRIDQINYLIGKADENAIHWENHFGTNRITAPTGLTVTPVPLPLT